MIKTLTAHTAEIDDVNAAASEILSQLKPEENLLKNTVGILVCYPDFTVSGAVKEICTALPFDVVGSTTLGSDVAGSSDAMLLTMMVLTSDDICFSVGLSAPFSSEDDRAFAELSGAYEAAAAKLPPDKKPALMFSFAPLQLNVGGDFMINAFSAISGSLPNFGMIAVDNSSDYHDALVIHNGEGYRDRYAFIIAAGDVEPRFFMASVSSKRIFDAKGVVTASRGQQLQTVNNMPVTDYLQSLGLIKNEDGTILGINTFPFILDYNDGTTPIVRVIFATTPEGYAVCGGDIPVGATLTVGSMNAEDVLHTAGEGLSAALACTKNERGGKPGGILMFSCVGRYFALGYNPMEELELVRSMMRETGIPYQFTYSGGEFCPVYAGGKQDRDEQNKKTPLINRNHNDTFIILVF